jgi:hypothetical protein
VPPPSDIVLCTFNARYQHTAFGLRCLRANLGALREHSVMVEFDLQARPVDVAEQLLARRPRIIGLGVYVWNVALIAELVELLATLAPEVVVVLGGPEVSFELDAQPWTRHATAVIAGEGEQAFRRLCEAVLAGQPIPARWPAVTPPVSELALPYEEYTDDDLEHRVLYVEASRGCPYSCEFCLSALDEKVRAFDLDAFLAAMGRLLDRGARQFKFVDRTFNLKVATSTRILEFFLARQVDGLFLHFEMVPDRFPHALREVVRRFKPGTLQFEVGVQTLDAAVSERISRRQDVSALEDNLSFLREVGVHVHADLIAGLPGEDLTTFARGLDRLAAMQPTEIQLGILKRLRGAPIARHTEAFGMRYASRAPYEVLQTNALSFDELQGLKRFARLWDVVANSGNFTRTMEMLRGLRPSLFETFSKWTDFVHAREPRMGGLSLLRTCALLADFLDAEGVDARPTLLEDYRRGGRHEVPGFLAPASERRARKVTRQARHRA